MGLFTYPNKFYNVITGFQFAYDIVKFPEPGSTSTSGKMTKIMERYLTFEIGWPNIVAKGLRCWIYIF